MVMKKDVLTVELGKYKVNVPYLEFKGAQDGPHIFLSGGMHGDEVNGIAAIHYLREWFLKDDIEKDLAGRITMFPVLNPSGFAHMQRQVYEDNNDLNRSFGVDDPKTFAEQIAYDLTHKILKECEFGIDFHDSGSRKAFVPHSRMHKGEKSGCTRELAQLFGTDIIIERQGHERMMSVALHRQFDMPVLTVEMGGAQRIFKEYLKVAKHGVRNFLRAKKMLAGSIMLPDKQYFLEDRYGVIIKAPATVSFDVNLGDFVHRSERIGEIYYPLTQENEEIVATSCGYILARWMESQIPEGESIYDILATENCHPDGSSEEKAALMQRLDISKIEM